MKVAKVTIEDFRHIKKLELDFTDSLRRVRDITVIVGPNTSGKTSILDAIAAGIGLATGLAPLRPGFVLSPRTVVRRGAIRARVTSIVRFSPDEIEATRRLSHLSDEGWVPDRERVEMIWTYPSKQHKLGRTQCSPSQSCKLPRGRATAARLLSTGRPDLSWFRRVGGVFTFDQQRTGMGKTIRRDIWEIIQGVHLDVADLSHSRYTTDPKTILLDLAIKSAFPSQRDDQPDQFSLIKEKYNQVCRPHELVDAIRGELGDLALRFRRGEYEYGYDGLSSGEQMMLLFLIRMVTEHIHRSIVLIDELELHQHPIWQRKLLDLLPKIGVENQFIVTTHSPYLRDNVPREAIIDLGELGDRE